jgi:hypothetical protein
VKTANKACASGVYTLLAECQIFARDGVAFLLTVTIKVYSRNVLKE